MASVQGSTSSSYDEPKKDAADVDFAPPQNSALVSPVHDKELEKLRRKQRLSAAFTVACAGVALISDGLQNNSALHFLSPAHPLFSLTRPPTPLGLQS